MKSTFKLIRRFIIILLLSGVLIFVFNVLVFVMSTYNDVNNSSGWAEAEKISSLLIKSKTGEYILQEEGREIIDTSGAWAILVENGTGNVVWHSEKLPKEVPLKYTVSEISMATRGYIADYPTTTGAYGDDLVILGFPKTIYWKLMWNTFDYQMIANLPKTVLKFLVMNIFLIFIIYMVVTSGLVRAVRPIVNAIETLPQGREGYVKEKGLLSDLAAAINRTSEKLWMQERTLQKKETARANWISGVSHDIRTPLSMVMGYAGQLEEDTTIPEKERRKAKIIRQQSIKMKNLVNDLNLASKLEYNMQPVNTVPVNLISLVRKIVVDFMNLELDGKYPIDWYTPKDLAVCMVEGDSNLISRAVSNVITNAQVHNPNGCTISVEVIDEMGWAQIIIEDDGAGMSEEQLEQLKNTPHYMMSDDSTTTQRHGLGLLIVRQIMEVHHGNVTFEHGKSGGFRVQMNLPLKSDS